VVLTLLIAGAEGVIPTGVMAGVVASLKGHYHSSCVFLLRTTENSVQSTYLLHSLQICQREDPFCKWICLMLKG
jgi:hypothetical protein